MSICLQKYLRRLYVAGGLNLSEQKNTLNININIYIIKQWQNSLLIILKYNHEFAPHDWEDRQKHLAALFAEDSNIVFGEGTPTEAQQAQGLPYNRVFEHRVYHLKCNPDIILVQIANSIDVPLENNFEQTVVKNEPSLFVIIDNRQGVRTIAIQNRRKAFSAPKRVADILAEKISNTLSNNYCYSLQILPDYYPKDLFKAWEEQQRNAQAMQFPSTYEMSDEEILRKVQMLKTEGKEYFDDSLVPSLLAMSTEAKKAKYKQKYRVMPEDKKTALYVDKTTVYMRNLLTLARATDEPVEIVTYGGTTFRCFVESDEDNTDKIVHHSFDDHLLEMLFKGKRADGQKAEPEDIDKAEGKVVEMLNDMKHLSEDVEAEENVA